MDTSNFSVVFFIYIFYFFDIASSTQNTTTIVFAFSGLRWDSLSKFNLSSFRFMQSNGAYVERKIDPFQTESLPSFITMATGQFPDSHGIISNVMLDVKKGSYFHVDTKYQYWWKNVKPFWIENQLTGNKSALCYWPGYGVTFNGSKVNLRCNDPKYINPLKNLYMNGHKETMPFSERLNKVKEWLSLNETQRPNFIGVFFEEPIASIRKYGYERNETLKAFDKINNITREMLNYLKPYTSVNFIVLGESGITELDKSKEIYLEDYIDGKLSNYIDIIDNGPIMTLHTNKKLTEKRLYALLRNANKHMTVYSKRNLTKSMHYAYPGRTCPIVLVADEHWHIYRDRMVDSRKAMMGFDGKFKSTHSLFLATGPNFKKGVKVRVMGNKDIYYILRKILGFTSSNKTLEDRELLEKLLIKIEKKWYTNIVKKVTNNTLNMTLAIIFAVVVLFTVTYLIIASIFKCVDVCNCYGKTVKLNVSPSKLLKARKAKDGRGHLLSEDEISSDESDTENELKEIKSSR